MTTTHEARVQRALAENSDDPNYDRASAEAALAAEDIDVQVDDNEPSELRRVVPMGAAEDIDAESAQLRARLIDDLGVDPARVAAVPDEGLQGFLDFVVTEGADDDDA